MQTRKLASVVVIGMILGSSAHAAEHKPTVAELQAQNSALQLQLVHMRSLAVAYRAQFQSEVDQMNELQAKYDEKAAQAAQQVKK